MSRSNQRSAYGKALVELGAKNKDVVVLDADLCKSTQSTMFEQAYPERYFEMGIKEQDMRAGIAISPNTPYEAVLPYLNLVDMVLVMTVEPGFGGQKLIPETLEKVRKIREYANANNINIDIEVDGGINEQNAILAVEAGANVLVAGSAIFGSKNPAQIIQKMREEPKEPSEETTIITKTGKSTKIVKKR